MNDIPVSNPSLEELIYTVLYSMPYERQRDMDIKYRNACLTERAAKKFASNCSREEMEYVMAFAGLKYFYVLTPKSGTVDVLFDLLKRYKKDQRGKTLETIVENNIYVSGDAEFMRMLGYAQRTINHPNYFLNVELLRIGNDFKKWSKRVVSDQVLINREISETTRNLVKVLAASAITISKSEQIYLTPVGSIILMILYSSYNEIPEREIITKLNLGYSHIAIRKSLREMVRELLIEKNVDDSRRSYTITGLGIKKVNQILEEIKK